MKRLRGVNEYQIALRRRRRRARLHLRKLGYEGNAGDWSGISGWLKSSPMSGRKASAVGWAVGTLWATGALVRSVPTSSVRRRGKSEFFLELLAAILPRRIANDYVGDALELIAENRTSGGSRRSRFGMVLATIYSVIVAVARSGVSAVVSGK